MRIFKVGDVIKWRPHLSNETYCYDIVGEITNRGYQLITHWSNNTVDIIDEYVIFVEQEHVLYTEIFRE